MNSKVSVYTGFQFEEDGFPALAIINTDLKTLTNKTDFKYSIFIEIVPDLCNENGQPEEKEYEYLVEIENRMISYLESETRTVHVGHVTLNKRLEVIFYTKDCAIVEDYLENYLPTINREARFYAEEDKDWEFVSSFYENL
jgi:hypothetical protein